MVEHPRNHRNKDDRVVEQMQFDPRHNQLKDARGVGRSEEVDIELRLEAQGIHMPLYFLRVGQDYYARKGG